MRPLPTRHQPGHPANFVSPISQQILSPDIAAVVVWSFWPGNRRTQQTGPVSTAHAAFNNDCAQCHTRSLTPLARLVHGDSVRAVPNDACKVCHDGGPHYETLDDCATCHREHLGKPELARVPDGYCIT
jgi:hypothetical protein